MSRTHDFNLGVAFQAQRHARQAWDIANIARNWSPDRWEILRAQREAAYAAREARDEYAITHGYRNFD